MAQSLVQYYACVREEIKDEKWAGLGFGFILHQFLWYTNSGYYSWRKFDWKFTYVLEVILQ